MNQVPTITLSDNVHMPQLGLGVFQVWNDDDAQRAVETALEAGYRSIDTARHYKNEIGVGRAIAASGLPREELFITTKLFFRHNGYESALRGFGKSLERLGLEDVDLYLIHWPVPSTNRYVDSWRALERILAEDGARAIGVSNFVEHRLDELRDKCTVVPALNQIEIHPWFRQRDLVEYNRRHGIVTEAWSPLAQGGGFLDDPTLRTIAEAHGKTVAQVILRWHVQLGNVVIPKSVNPKRIAENIDIFDFALSSDDMARIDGLENGTRTGPDPETDM